MEWHAVGIWERYPVLDSHARVDRRLTQLAVRLTRQGDDGRRHGVLHTLSREQRLEGTPAEVFPFFADAGNLEAITPPWLGFRVVTPRPIEMRVGALIEYRLTLHGFPVGWLTRIEEWVPGERFVDAQIHGPYTLWHHTHEFAPHPDGGTLMRDTVRYALPYGPLGEIARRLFVARDLERIFAYRERTLSLYGPRKLGPPSDVTRRR